ncbi:MAG TPA: hypothetical protein VEJ86_07395 [Candidatus Binataceae bacterium]|nr:hypothetical protein [Candidatus Binataceae bacterium]
MATTISFRASSDYDLNRFRLGSLITDCAPASRVLVRLLRYDETLADERTWTIGGELPKLIDEMAEFIRGDWSVSVIF